MSRAWRGWLAPVALGVGLLSLAGNLFLLWQLRHPERWAAPAAVRLLEEWAARDATLRYTVHIPPGTPLRLDVPVDERFSIRVDTVLPIDTRVRVPLKGPLGTYNATLPIRASIPLRTQLPLHVRHTFHLRTRTSREIAIPLEIRLHELPLESLRSSVLEPRPDSAPGSREQP